jgi:Leucine-rich repeat (LRR) protein
MQVIGNLQQLTFLDASKNYIESVADEIERCLSLTDLYLSNNRLQQLPESIGNCLLLCTVRNE